MAKATAKKKAATKTAKKAKVKAAAAGAGKKASSAKSVNQPISTDIRQAYKKLLLSDYLGKKS